MHVFEISKLFMKFERVYLLRLPYDDITVVNQLPHCIWLEILWFLCDKMKSVSIEVC